MIKKTSLSFIAALLLSTNAYAGAGHSHDHGHEEHEEAEIYKGNTPFGQECFLSIKENEQSEDMYDVETNLDHGGSGPGELTINQAEVDVWIGQNQVSVIAIQTDATANEFTPTAFIARWLHAGHVDSALCENLQLTDLEEIPGSSHGGHTHNH